VAQRFMLDLPKPQYAETDKEALQLLKRCLKLTKTQPNDPFGFDTETHAKKLPFKVGARFPIDHITDTITFWSIAFKVGSIEERWCLQQKHFVMFSPLLENPETTLAIWNAKFDTHISWNSGLNILNCKVIDVLIMANYYDENYQGRLGLKESAKRWLGLQMVTFKDLFKGVVGPDGKPVKEYETPLFDLPLDRVVDYASDDAYAHLMLYYFLRDELERIPLNPDLPHDRTLWDLFQEVEIDMTETLWKMERRGMPADREHIETIIPKLEKEILKVETDINREAGKPTNINSPKQLQALFFGPKKEGGMGLEPLKRSKKTEAPSCDEEVLDKLATNHGIEVARMIIRARKLKKVQGTYANPLLNMVDYFPDGRIHPSFNQYGARTGRFSTTGPNSQNFPRPDTDEWKIRDIFVAGPGKVLIVIDYGQLEMRITADRTKDKNMLQAILKGEDLHCRTVALAWPGVEYEDVVAAKKAEDPTDDQKELKALRQRAKTTGFGIIYGIGPPGLSKQLGIPFEEAKDLINLYLKKAYPGVNDYIKYVHALCAENRAPDVLVDPERQKRFVTTILGRRRRLPDIVHHNRDFRGAAERESFNAIVQGSASDITKCAMLRIDYSPLLIDRNVQILNQIHDEIVMEVPEEHAEEVLPVIEHMMINPFGDGEEVLEVPLTVDAKIVDRWSEAK